MTRRGRVAGLLLAGLAALHASCGAPPEPGMGPAPEGGRAEPPEEAAPAPGEETGEAAGAVEGPLPPIPRRIGPLDLRVQYPGRHQRISVRDSNFLFGSVRTGDASLEIDGRSVPVEPNGAFLAFLPVPESRGDTAVYRLVARRPGEADTLLHPVRVPPRPYFGPPGEVWVDTTALWPPVVRWALPDERLEFRVRGAPGLHAWLEVAGERFPLEEGPDPAGAGPAGPAAAEVPGWRSAPASGLYRTRIAAGRLARAAERELRPALAPARAPPRGEARREAWPAGRPMEGPAGTPIEDALPTPDTLVLTVVAAGDDTVRLPRRLPLRVLDPERPPVVALYEAPDSVNGPSGVVVGRPGPYGPYRWRFPLAARALVDGRVADRLRLRLAPHESAWVLAEDVLPLPEGTPAPASRVGNVRLEPRRDRLILRVGLEVPLPIQVEEPDERTIVLTLYGGEGETERIAYGEIDPLLESIRWEQASEGLYRIVLRLRHPVWGHRATYEMGDWPLGDRSRDGALEDGEPTLRFEVRRPPPVDPSRPLRGRRIAVDPGHPRGGAHGPTGLFEGDANLAIARWLVEMLRTEEAEPILIRADTLPMGLYERTSRALEAGAELFVSIHNNAFPDGVRPFGREGTGTFYYHPHSRELAAAVQAGLLAEMGLRDLGIQWGDLAVARLSWMPSVLAEGAFMMIPSHEAALRQPEFQARYARGVLRGIRDFLAARAAWTGAGR